MDPAIFRAGSMNLAGEKSTGKEALFFTQIRFD